ncbi:nuclease [Streptomyces coeruleorubidus]|uniref:nuclease n=1 Tax=Streptomyces coeruleorubidus TaxID=116188 RepID=UPI0036915277
MPMLLIKGSYQIIGARPDGDTVNFTPDDPTEWDLVGGFYRVEHNTSGKARLRLEAIDALETHYARTGPEVHQPLAHGHAAQEELLRWLGFTSVQRDAKEKVTAATPATVPGWILTRGAAKDRRCIALAGRGTPPGASGTEVFVDAPMLKTTVNHHLLAAGLAYPTYYRSLYADLRTELTAAVHQAQAATPAIGLWADDVTLSGATVTGMSSITKDNGAVILPKLFRRLVDYLNLGDPDLSGFPAFLDQAQDKFWILSTGQSTTGLDAVVEVINSKVRMTHPSEDLVFDE